MPPSPRAAVSTTSTATPCASWPAPPWASFPVSCRRTRWSAISRRFPGPSWGFAGHSGRHRSGRPPVRGPRLGCVRGCPMVSWGTTANVSVPVHERPVPSPAGAVVTRAADGGWLLEGGLSAAGSFLAWLGRLLGRSPDELATLAAASPPGANGVIAVRGSTGLAPLGGGTTPGPASWVWARPTDPVTCPGGDRVGGLGRPALHGGRHGGSARGEHRRRGHPGRSGHRSAPLGARSSRPSSACRRPGTARARRLGRSGAAGRSGPWDELEPRAARPRRGRDRARSRVGPGLPGHAPDGRLRGRSGPRRH